MADLPDVVLNPAAANDAALLSNLLELYIHDLSAAFPGIELGADGRFGYSKLPLYWSEPDRRFPFLITCDARVAGFALATRGSPASDDPDVFDVAEFFVIRGHRRSGVGRRAAMLLWNRLPGSWIVRASDSVPAAVSFWRSAVAEFTGGATTESRRPGHPHGWHVFSFASGRGDETRVTQPNSTVTVRTFRAADREQVEQLWARIFPGDPPSNAPALLIDAKLRVQPELFLIAVADGAVVGAVMAGFDGVRGWIYHLAVSPESRRRGVGTALVRAAETGLGRLGCPKVNLQVRATNSDVVAFYRQLGYAVEDRVSMGRRLEGAQ